MDTDERMAAAERAYESACEDLFALPNVVGAGVGYRERGGEETDKIVVQVLVERKVPADELSAEELIPSRRSPRGRPPACRPASPSGSARRWRR
jgi:hypothetical protein